MKKSIIFAAFISLLMAFSCTDSGKVKDDALEGESNGTNTGPGKEHIMDDSAQVKADSSNAHMH
ncbi:MAG: hypothetical protein H7321_06080 [Bacteroidia bacterium]|nr:hypothetical protein [Bacteroidia bacterium]